MNYCPHCGALQAPKPVTQWPHVCPACKTELFNSPKPVIALVLNAWGAEPAPHPGVLLIQRGIDPHKGEWAFPGGYIDHAEGWRLAAVREAREELGLLLDPKHMILRPEPVVTSTNYLVLFVGYSGDVLTIDSTHRSPFEQTNGEILDIKVGHDPTLLDLGVPSHNNYWKNLPLLTSGTIPKVKQPEVRKRGR